MTLREYDRTAHDLADAIKPTYKDASEWAVRLHDLKQARVLLDGGEVLSLAEAKKETDALTEALRSYLVEHDDLRVEGLPRMFLQQRSGPWIWDVESMHNHDPGVFDRGLTHGAITVNDKIATELEKSGLWSGFRGYGHQSASTPAVQFERKK